MTKFAKGQSGNPDGRQRKPKDGETLALSVVNLAIPDQPREISRTSPFFTVNANESWIPFGSDNLFPQAIATLNRQSPVHRGILNNKAVYTSAKGFSLDEKNAKLKAFVSKANNKNQTLRKVVKNLIVDKYHSGNAYLEIVKGQGFLNIFHRDYTTARVSKDGKSILFHSDWTNVVNSIKNIKKIPLYPAFEKIDGQMRSVFHFKCYEPEFTYYGLPDWIASMDAAGICYKTNKWNLSRLDNSFVNSGVLLVEGNMSPKEAKKLKADFKKEFIGEGKQGKLLFLIKQLGEGGKTAQSNYTSFNDVKDADWLNLHKQGIQDLLISHNWFRSLSGLAEAGSMGNTQQIRNEYSVALNTVIEDDQEFFIEELKKILLADLGIDASTLAFINKPPISMIDLIDLDTILDEDEKRSIAGYAPRTIKKIPEEK